MAYAIAYLRARLLEASTWAGIGAAVLGGAQMVDGALHDGLVLASVAAGAIAVLVPGGRAS